MPYCSRHGGGCCGIIHLQEFDYYGPSPYVDWPNRLRETIYDKMRSYYENEVGLSEWNCLVEVVLTSQQANNGWRKILEEMGFKEVNKFYNSNSGNICHVLHLQTKELK